MKPPPVTQRGRRTRAAIVGAAADLMHRKGLAAPSMDDVLAAGGAGKSQLYHYFGSRHDLTVAVLNHMYDAVLANQPALLDDTCTDLWAWYDQLVAALHTAGYRMCPLGAFIGQVDGDPVLRDTLAGLFTQWQDRLAALVDRSRQAGQVRPDANPDEAGRLLLAAMQGGTALSHLHRDDAPLRDLVGTAIRALEVTRPPAPA